jgi:RND superfamily putative drug exporter
MNTLARLAIERPKSVLFAWLLLFALAVPFALQLNGALKAGGFSDPRGEAVHAQQTLNRAFDEAPNSLLVVLHDPSGDATEDVAAARRAAEGPGVSRIEDYRSHPEWVSRDAHTTFLQVGFTSDNTTVQNLVPRLREDVAAEVGETVDVQVTGSPALDYSLNLQSKQDATRAEMIAFPVLFVVLLLVFRSVASMAVPLALAGVTLTITQGIGYVVAQYTDVSNLFTNIVSLVGLAVAVDYSLFIVKRFREELAEGRDVPEALERTMRTVGHSVLFSGIAVIVALFALFIPRAMSFTSIALGGVGVTVIAVAVATTLLPAVLRLMGHRINWGSLRRRGSGAAPQPAARASGSRLVRWPAAVLAVMAIAFAALSFPATRLTLQVPVASADILPSDDSARIGIERIKQDIGLREMFPVQLVLTADQQDSAALLSTAEAVTAYAGNAPHAAKVQGVSTLGIPAAALPQAVADGGSGLPPEARAGLSQVWSRTGNTLVTRVVVTPDVDPDTTAAHELVKDLRAGLDQHTETGVTAEVAGATATGTDFDNLVERAIPLVVGAVALITFVILVLAFRSWLTPLLALIFNAAVVSASLGVLALISQDDAHVINSVTPPMLFAVMFGLSMDYMVIMISRMREMYLTGASHREAVLGGLARTAGLVNGAAAIMVAVFVSFTSARISIVRELGISLAVAVILDAVVVRRLIMPNALLLLGKRVWGRAGHTVHAHKPSPIGPPSSARGTDYEEIPDAHSDAGVR